jgi:Na+/melibiose symporter-like transporter
MRHIGRRGNFFGIYAFAGKALIGVGTWLGGVILDLIEFPANAVPGTVPEETLVKLALAASPLLAIGGLASLVFLRSYQISKARHEHTQAQLIDRAPATGATWDVAQPGAPQTD